MAAALGGESQPFPGALSGAGPGVGGSPLSLGLPRGLERALEEAAHSGALNLSARKLKEFPSRAAVAPGHDLSDTVRADLSKNRLSEVPMELCHFVSLETLNLYHNCIKIIPDAIVNLQMLTYLNLSRNQLSSLPACLCGLPLKVLIASNNKLGSLPEEIGQLKQLMELDVSCNEITALPQQIGQLKSLRELNIRRNYLKVLPPELVDLPLVKFDFSCNKVLVIPICFRKMVQLQVLLLENNPLQSPPAQICIKGKVHIFKYLSIQACQIKSSDSLYLSTIERPHLHIDDIYPIKKDSDSGVGSDNGDKRLSATEPLDEDTVSLNVPMSNIMEEDQVVKEEPGHRVSSIKGVINREKKTLIWFDLTRILPTSIICNTCLNSSTITNSSVMQGIDIAMINQLREAVDLLQDSNRYAHHITCFSWLFLRPQRNLESIDPQFTIRRKMEQMREEREMVEQLRENIETRLKICLPEDLGSALMDGVVLCHLINHIRPRSVASIHVPSPAVPKLSMAKCRRNVENFLDACRKLGIPEADLCSPYDILQSDIRHIRKTVDTLLALGEWEKTPQSTSAFRSWDLIGFCLFHILFIVLMYITYHWDVLAA
uniref:Leucine rich repeats and calponin homology domain containing 1 n=1 Tax=Sphenodon punctatus TaxID=8508 RepID=A0A8D0HCS5_SPHPU